MLGSRKLMQNLSWYDMQRLLLFPGMISFGRSKKNMQAARVLEKFTKEEERSSRA